MNNKNKAFVGIFKNLIPFFIIIITILFGSIQTSADEALNHVPYNNYYFWNNSNEKKAIADKPVFEESLIIDGRELGISSFSNISDICVSKDQSIYILDSGNDRIVKLNSDLTLSNTIDHFVLNGNQEKLNGAQGIYVDEKGQIIIADTENMRVLFCEQNGNITKVISSPKGDLIPDDFKFYPIKCVKDGKGFLYILSKGSYYGALTYDDKNEFCGFYGSNSVVANPVEKVERVFTRMFSSNEGAMYKAQKLPYQFVDLYVGSDNLLYTVSPNEKSMMGQIRKLSPTGQNVLYCDASNYVVNSDSFNFGEEKLYKTNSDNVIKQNFNGVSVDENGYIYALDSAYGKIYVYDSECNSICVMGCGLGNGNQKGSFRTPTAIETSNGRILVADSEKNSLTVFSKTNYGKCIFKADTLSLQGKYLNAEYYWKDVLKISKNNQLAYKRIGQAAFAKEDYRTAMKYAKISDDQKIYAQAFKQRSNMFISSHLWVIVLSVVLIAGGIITLIVVGKKKHTVLIKNKKIRVFFRAVIHPFDSFYKMKFQNQETKWLPFATFFLFYVVTVLKTLLGGFMYTIVSDKYNALLAFGGSAGIAIIFVIVNWAVCSLFEGKGMLKDIFNVVACAMIPQILNGIFYIIASHVIAPGASTIITTVAAVCNLWSFVLLIVGLIFMHDFSFGKMIFTSFLTVIGVVLIIFIAFMIMTFFQNFVSFVVSLFREAIMR